MKDEVKEQQGLHFVRSAPALGDLWPKVEDLSSTMSTQLAGC